MSSSFTGSLLGGVAGFCSPPPSRVICRPCTSTLVRLSPLRSVYSRMSSSPCTATCFPLVKYCVRASACLPQSVTRTQIGWGFCPFFFWRSTARLKLDTALPPVVYRCSASPPSRPTNVTLFKEQLLRFLLDHASNGLETFVSVVVQPHET